MSNSVKEMTNVCDMPRRACIIIHKSDLTGAYYLEIVSYDDYFETKQGLWTDVEIAEKDVEEIAKIINRCPKH